MAKGELPTWVMPVMNDRSGNVWVLLIETKQLRSLRVFRHEPTAEMVEYNRKVIEGKLEEPATAHVHEVALDWYEEDEIENAGC